MSTDPDTVCIVGMGLMGGSLALAWQSREAPLRVVGVDRDSATLEAARAAGAIQAGTTDLAEGLVGADAVILATPVRTILRLLPEVGRHAAQGALVMDLGSSKGSVCAAMEALPEGVQPVGGHPMCGTEHAGFGAASAGLYQGCAFVLCPLPRTAPGAVDLAGRLVTLAGAQPLVAAPDDHDRAVAAISHLPYAVAAALVGAVTNGAVTQGTGPAGALAWRLAASGFRDTTRVAAANVDVMLDALLTNRQAVLAWLEAYDGQLARLREALAGGDEDGLREQLTAAQAQRRMLPGKNI